MSNTEPVRVTIFNQTYSLVASSEEPGRIEQLAQRVDDLMSTIAVRAGNVDSTRTAVLACLHLADELESIERRLNMLKDDVEHKARHFTVLLDEAIGGTGESSSASFVADHG
jgi:cell division protein ZapA